MRIGRFLLAATAVLAAAPLLAGCAAPRERPGPCPDPEAREQIRELANHFGRLAAGFRERDHQQEELAHRLQRFMERVERLEVASRQGGHTPSAREWEDAAEGDGEGAAREVQALRHRLEEMEQARKRIGAQLEELERARTELRAQVNELEKRRRELERK